VSRRFPRDTRDVGVGPVLAVAGLLAFLAVCAPVVKWLRGRMLARLEREDSDRPVAYSVLPPAPRLQAHPAYDLARMRDDEAAVMDGWGWRDKKAGLARVPIERAIQELAREGAPRGSAP
jgi:hypothetical protein